MPWPGWQDKRRRSREGQQTASLEGTDTHLAGRHGPPERQRRGHTGTVDSPLRGAHRWPSSGLGGCSPGGVKRAATNATVEGAPTEGKYGAIEKSNQWAAWQWNAARQRHVQSRHGGRSGRFSQVQSRGQANCPSRAERSAHNCARRWRS